MTPLFRKKALTKMMSREGLDEPVRNLFMWGGLAKFTFLFTLVMAGVWGYFGSLPEEGQGRGILMTPNTVVPVQAAAGGQIRHWTVSVGDFVKEDQVLGLLDQPAIEQELRQSEDRLAEVQTKNRQITVLRERASAVERESLKRREAWLKVRADYLKGFVERTRGFAKAIYEKDVARLADQRKAHVATRAATVKMVASLKKRYESQLRLREKKLAPEDAVVAARSRYEDKRLEVSSVDLEIQRLDLSRTEVEEAYANARNDITDRENALTDVLLDLRNLEKQAAALAKRDNQATFTDQKEIEDLERTIERARKRLKENSEIRSKYTGRILELSSVAGKVVRKGERLLQIDTRKETDLLVAIGYFHPKEGKQLEVGMSVSVSPNSVPRNRYGAIKGTIVSINDIPVTAEAVASKVGNSDLARKLTEGNHEIEVMIELELQAEGASGFAWTSTRGPEGVEVTAGTDITNWIMLERRRPWSYVLPKIREWTGIY